jgi:hypothetical protein
LIEKERFTGACEEILTVDYTLSCHIVNSVQKDLRKTGRKEEPLLKEEGRMQY